MLSDGLYRQGLLFVCAQVETLLLRRICGISLPHTHTLTLPPTPKKQNNKTAMSLFCVFVPIIIMTFQLWWKGSVGGECLQDPWAVVADPTLVVSLSSLLVISGSKSRETTSGPIHHFVFIWLHGAWRKIMLIMHYPWAAIIGGHLAYGTRLYFNTQCFKFIRQYTRANMIITVACCLKCK